MPAVPSVPLVSAADESGFDPPWIAEKRRPMGTQQENIMDAKTPENIAPSDASAIDGIKDLRNTVEWLRREGDLIDTNTEVNPDLEIVGL